MIYCDDIGRVPTKKHIENRPKSSNHGKLQIEQFGRTTVKFYQQRADMYDEEKMDSSLRSSRQFWIIRNKNKNTNILSTEQVHLVQLPIIS